MKFKHTTYCGIHKFFALLIVMSSTFFLVANCSKPKIMYANLREVPNVAEGFLHYVDFTDYREDTTFETLDPNIVSGACTTIRCGDIYGRNFDFYYNNSVTYIAHVAHTDTRFESIGVSRHEGIDKQTVEDIEASGVYNKHIELIPNLTLDGINENGVVCNCNVVDLENFPITTGTNPGKKRLYMYFVCRYILDNARSADHAIDLLNERDIFLSEDATTNAHLMIADHSKTYIVEFIANQVIVKEKTGDNQIMTNFYNNLNDNDPSGLSSLSENACGMERYRWSRGREEDLNYFYHGETAFKNYPDDCKKFFTKWEDLNTIPKMMEALKNNKISRAYTTLGNDGNPYPIWPSEDCSQTVLKTPELFTQWKNNTFPKFCEEFKSIVEAKRRDIGREKDVWVTNHSSVYDIAHKTLTIAGEEDFDHPTTFTVSGEIK